MGVCVIGAGSWGTGIAHLLQCAGAPRVQWYCRDAEQALALNRDGRNPRHFPKLQLREGIFATTDMSAALHGCVVAYIVLPAAGIRPMVADHTGVWELWQDESQAANIQPVICNCSKGLLSSPTQRSDAWLSAALPRAQLVHLSGPNLAAEIIAGQPAAAVAASYSAGAAQAVQRQLSSEQFRVYTGDDLIGVEVAGFYKNIIAIAAGMAHGLGLGANARAGLITRGLAEMGRLVAHFGGDPATLQGLAGVGDLIVTCSSPLSRNFQVGQRIASGQSLAQVEAEMTETAEGVNASRALWEFEETGSSLPDLPIARQVTRILHEGADPQQSIIELMRRPLKAE